MMQKKSLWKIYIKAFLAYALVFGALMTLWEYYDSKHINIWKQIFQALFFGVVMTWINMRSQKKALNKDKSEDAGKETGQ